jgi:predicted Fe-Mo cluster-binding NifX family protein
MNTEKATVESLQARGFDVIPWTFLGETMIQVTDARGVTFYGAPDWTLEQFLERYAAKQRAFERAEQMK